MTFSKKTRRTLDEEAEANAKHGLQERRKRILDIIERETSDLKMNGNHSIVITPRKNGGKGNNEMEPHGSPQKTVIEEQKEIFA